MVVSVPHSGTRTLVQHLALSAKDQRMPGGRWWHFGNCAALLRKYRPHLHIPVRDPMHVARSWARRNRVGDVIEDLLRRYEHMFEVLEHYEGAHTLYRMEDLPRLTGMDGPVDAPDQSPRITEFQEAVRRKVVEPHDAFFREFYGDELDRSGHP